ncbi:asparagine synthetase B family protein [Lentzea sp. NPDC051213]|uniref:asparagine synthetase B family protein n=1 Tax=Lentzea sp. NPDC051213 TaxID=3364126 RepID=UPI00379C9339
MSGITGWVSFGQDLTIRHDVLAAMTATLAPRGPDAGGMWTSKHAALGNRRLAVLDPAGGAQPMSVEHVTITYNGEVFNFQELRADLRGRGHRFTTGTDTEVVLRGYLEWGLGVVERLNGMFAFALWDARGQRLVLVRDRLGVKPLHYYPVGNGLLFGSEPKAIFAHPASRKEVDADGLRELFTHSHTPGRSGYKGLHEVKPGTILTADRSGLREHVYWRLETAPHLDDDAETAEEIRRLLQDTVARQLVSDVPVGVLHSRSIAALAAVPAFSLSFGGDAPIAGHEEIVLDPVELAQLRIDAVRARDLPQGAGDLDFSLLALCRVLRDRVSVVVSGEGADELFGGHPWYHEPMVQQAHTFPWLVGSRAPFLRPDVLEILDLDTYVADGYATAIREIGRLPGEADQDWRLRKMTYLHLTRYLRVLLDRLDRMSAAAGLEARAPFTDHRLVEYVYNAPSSLKTFDGKENYPSVEDSRYVAVLRDQYRELASDHPVFELVDRAWRVDAEPDRETRGALEQVLDLAEWLDVHRPHLKL